VGQVHAHDGVAVLEHGEIGGHVGLGAAHRLDVDMLGPGKELLAPLLGQHLGPVHICRAAVVALARIAFSILVGHDAALGLHDRPTGEILGGDQNDVIALPLQLILDGSINFGVLLA